MAKDKSIINMGKIYHFKSYMHNYKNLMNIYLGKDKVIVCFMIVSIIRYLEKM